MKVQLYLGGKIKKSPEKDIFCNYLDRFKKLGNTTKLFPIEIHEYDEKKMFSPKQLYKLRQLFSKRSTVTVLLDERGCNLSSVDFAEFLRENRDAGLSEIIFFVGGANGVPTALKVEFNNLISFGRMVWPHMIARIMLMEQLYRASSVIAGSPYHKE
ncbi:MAG: 23S rRNA (pseudouridine(1915)-N(3))-methyltransferase RlmH [Pseudomonadota bacterium]|nr:23S rRNA (pseudouridine(1915)-N(3))-methyltransferase RlmH [Pseudomonadota bacterium]